VSEEEQIRALSEAAFWSEHHRKRRDNPHGVTAEQVGATGGGGDPFDPAEIEGRLDIVEAHLIDFNNPHGVTAEQLGISEGGGGGSLLKYHPIWMSADTTTITGLLGSDKKWCGGVLGPDGKIYGIPHAAGEVLIIDPATQTADTTTITGLPAVAAGQNWWGGTRP